MTRKEFVKNATQIGYCTKKQAEKYSKDKEEFTEDDYISVFRKAEDEGYKHKGISIGNGNRTTKRYFADGGEEGNR